MDDDFDPTTVFAVAQARRNGFTRTDLDSPLLQRPFHGLRMPRQDALVDDTRHPAEIARELITSRAIQFGAHMHTGEFFSHTTAAVLWSIALPPQSDADIHVSVESPHRAPRGAGVRGHQLTTGSFRLVRHPTHDIVLTDPASTWALLASALRHPYDLVAAAESIVRVDRLPGPRGRALKPALSSIPAIRAAIPRGRRGTVALSDTIERVRAGSASRMETWLRLTLIDAGLPEPLLDHDVYAHDGRFIGCVDLVYAEARIAIEYEGDQHRTDAVQWQRDIVKHDDLVRAGWRVIRVTREQLVAHPGAVVARVRHALHAAR